MTKKEMVNRAVSDAIESVRRKATKKARTEEIINHIIDCFESQTGSIVLNKPYKLELEKSK